VDGTCRRVAWSYYRSPVPYLEALGQQHALRAAVEAGHAPPTLLLLHHPPTFTLGRNFQDRHLLVSAPELAAMGIEVHRTDRGGDVTYHGPGQLVAYPVLNLRDWKCSIRWYLRTLEEIVIRLLSEYGLHGERVEGLTGVWVGEGKVAAIGVGIRQWVTYHGLSLNVDPDMETYRHIIPCGIADRPVTSLARLLGQAPPMDDVAHRLTAVFTDQMARAALP
jgi:lipoyl(octanoyl) transferase